MSKSRRLIQDLLSINPTMVCVKDRNGSFPLQISIKNHQSFQSTKFIYDACPYIGREKDIDGFISFKLAAVGNWDNDIDQINTIYYLIVNDPIVLNY